MFVGIYQGSAAGLIPSLILTWLLGIFCLVFGQPWDFPVSVPVPVPIKTHTHHHRYGCEFSQTHRKLLNIYNI